MRLLNEKDPEISKIVQRYSRRHMSNYLEQKQITEEIDQSKDLEMISPIELDEESINYQSNDLQDNEDILIESTTRQKLVSYLSNSRFQNVLSFLSFSFSLIIYIIYIITTYFPLTDFHWFDILNVSLSIFHNLEVLLYLYLSHHRLLYILSIETIVFLFSSIYSYFYFIENNISKKVL